MIMIPAMIGSASLTGLTLRRRVTARLSHGGPAGPARSAPGRPGQPGPRAPVTVTLEWHWQHCPCQPLARCTPRISFTASQTVGAPLSRARRMPCDLMGLAGFWKMGFTLGDLYTSSLLLLNAVAILHEERFLAKCVYFSLYLQCSSGEALVSSSFDSYFFGSFRWLEHNRCYSKSCKSES